MRSDNVKAGMQQAPHRSLFNALGFTEEEMKKAASELDFERAMELRDIIFEMKVKYIGETDYSLTNGKEYEVIGTENGFYQIVDNSGEDYFFPPEEFEGVEQ
mgnify:CR=1 FL=1